MDHAVAGVDVEETIDDACITGQRAFVYLYVVRVFRTATVRI